MWLLSILLGLVVPLVAGAYYYVRRRFRFWTDHNLPQLEPTFPMGSLKGLTTEKHFVDIFDEAYHRFKASTPVIGMYFTLAPVLTVLDLDLVKNVMIKDFNNFHERGMYSNERDDPISGNLFALDGERWKFMRNKLSPTFTSGKIKSMFETIQGIGDEFLHAFDKYIDGNEPVDIKKLCQCFTCDVVGSCAFGLQCNSLRDGDSKMLEMGDRVFNPSKWENIRVTLIMAFKEMSQKLGLRLFPKDVSEYFMELVRSTVEYREKNSVNRADFLNLLIQLKNKGSVDGEPENSTERLTLNEVLAQAFVFLFAGFETSAAAQSFALFLLASHQDVQDKVREEVHQQLQLHDNQLSYEALRGMTYLDQVINETLRLYPPVPQLMRMVSEPYHIESANLTLQKGMILFLPVYSYHYDPEHFPDPQRFDPDRFTQEAIQKRHTHAFLPFGDGPRNCIGKRFGLLEVKFGIAQLISKLRFTVSDRMQMPMRISKKSNMLQAEGGLWVDATRL